MSPRTLSYTVPPEQDGRRVRSVLQGPLGLSAGLVTRLKHREGSVRVNGEPAKSIDVLRAGDTLEIDVGDAKKSAFSPMPGRLDVVWEDEDLFIVNKSAGMAVHGRSEKREPTVGALAAAYLGADTPFHPVNRLDRDTSGLMCAAKTGYMHERLRRILHSDNFRREYLALCEGSPPAERGTVDAPIARLGEEKRFCVDPSGCASVTHWEVAKRLGGLTLLRIVPETGRTHQIRVHMAYLGCPLLGDRLYGRASALIGRAALHSHAIRLVHPLSGELIDVSAPLPEDMRSLTE